MGPGKVNAAHGEVLVTLQNVADLPREGDPRYIDPRIPLPVRAVLRVLHAADDIFTVVLAPLDLVTRYVRGPGVLLSTSVMRVEPARTVARTDEHRIPPRARDALAAMETAVMSAGFGLPHRITHGNPAELKSVAALLEHAGTGDLATVICIVSGDSAVPKLTQVITFLTELADGHRVYTTSSSVPTMWPPPPGHDSVRLPHITDARELYAVHRFRVERGAHAASARPTTRGATEAERLAYTDREAQASQRHLIQIGYREPSADGLRLTRRGAVLSTWRGLWPWKQWTAATQQRRARAVLRAQERAARG